MSMVGAGDVDGWSGLFEGIEALVDLPALRRAWPAGLIHGPSVEVLVRLIGVESGLPLVELPAAVVDAVIAHPDPRTRLRMADAQQGMSLDQWVRLIAREPDAVYRRRARWMAVWRCRRPSAEEFARWAGDGDPQVRLRALWFRGLPEESAVALAADPDPEVRAEACGYAWPYLSEEQRSALVADVSAEVREAAEGQAGLDRPMSRAAYEALDSMGRFRAVLSQRLDRDLAEEFIHHPEYARRANLATNSRLDADLVAALARDEDPRVRAAVAVRPEVDEALRAEVDAGLDPDFPHYRVDWVEDLHEDPEAMRRLASSASLAVRRTVARARHLPPDVVDLLTRDPGRGVRSNLAVYCEGAPTELLLEAATQWQHPWNVLARPDFPRHALAGFADDPDPLRRRLALLAPGSTADLAERLADDPDEAVRVRAAADPRLAPATVLRLLDSTPLTREAAITNPRLPVPALIRLLRDPETARSAAANPALPAAVAHRLIDLATAQDSADTPAPTG
ncbi:PE-PGRS family protein [Kitasatospora camelliae]|uniref:PE-PGRS family protein n=1 Tax=Kitasatospora camelliae TaxID=3156397 RepID=A0AAU8JRE5_9ACTN